MTRGRLHVVCGPMFAGKTTELLRLLRAAQAAGRGTLAVKPARDVRYADRELVTHVGDRIGAMPVASLDQVLVHAPAGDAGLVAIDEIHFFASEAVAPIDVLLARGIDVAVAGCDIDHFGDVFAPFDALLPRADRVTRIAGTCARCGAPSTHSERLVASTDRIIVGGIGDFVATCAACFRPSRRVSP